MPSPHNLVDSNTNPAMADDEGQPDWLQLQADLLELIAEKTHGPVTGVTLFRSVCRAWRASVRDGPRLLLPLPFDSAAPRAVRAMAGSPVVRHGYKHFKEQDPDDAPAATADPLAHARPVQRRFLVKIKFRLAAAAPVGNRGKKVHRRWKVRMNPLWMKSLLPEKKESTPCSKYKIQIKILYFYMLLETDLAFSILIRFAAHVPARAPTDCTDGMLIMTYDPVQGHTGLSFCRPDDATWTMVPNTVTHNDEEYSGRWSCLGFVNFAYHEGKFFAMDKTSVTAVLDATTLDVLSMVLVDAPPDTTNFSAKLFDHAADDDGQVDHIGRWQGRPLNESIRHR
ncbi:hypothetical protein QOZ80_7AG0561220 [Eleusine coracana subsp. coracana]|nr:hypothetical protein QOZ80_7AG0561220 [Eleusine coracana subsp. coracana]